MKYERSTAIKTHITSIVGGIFKKSLEEPGHVVTPENKKIARANMIGVCIEVKDPTSFVVDDATASILVRSFENNHSVSVGDVLNVIGKPRDFQSTVYIVPEIVKKITNKKWVDLRKKELGTAPKVIIQNQTNDPLEEVLKTIRTLDVGAGADFEEVVSQSKLEGAEKIINRMLEEGEVFEIKPGRLKILE